MKGFVGGVPVALLAAAALAQAQEGVRGPAQVNRGNNIRRHHVEYVPSGNTAIGGPGGSDTGNSAGINFDSEFSSEVNDAHSDDHAVDVDKATDYHPHPVHNEVEHPYPHLFPEPIVQPIPIPIRKRQIGNTAIGGASGSDVGNEADVSLESEVETEVNEGTIPPPYYRHAKRQGNSAMGGPGGSDSGNSAGYDSENEFESKVKDHHHDDHHIDYDEVNDIHPHPVHNEAHSYPVPHPYAVPVIVKRQGNSAIGGPGGSDSGNSAGYGGENEFESEVNDAEEDDHHIDYDELNDIHPHPVQNDITEVVEEPYAVPVIVKRQGNSAIGGPGGSDSGNSADYDSENEFESKVKDHHDDDHHIDDDEVNDIHPHPVHNEAHSYPVPEPYPEFIPEFVPTVVRRPFGGPGLLKRQGNSAIGGPGGSDSGNSAGYDSENEFESKVKDHHDDDHHIDDDEVNDIHPHPVHNEAHSYPVPEPYPEFIPEFVPTVVRRPFGGPGLLKRQGNSAIGGPGGSDSGNDASYEPENEFESEVNDANADDHHIDYDELNDVHPHPVYNDVDSYAVPEPYPEIIPAPVVVKRQGDFDFDFDSDSDSDSDSDDEHYVVPFDGGNTAIGGPGGSDTGNDAGFDFDSEFESEVNDKFKDDHHIDYDEANDVHPHPVHNEVDSYPVPEPYPEFIAEYVPEVVSPFGGPGLFKRQGNSAIGGPGGSDSGNDAGYSGEQEFESEVDDKHEDDHHIDASVVNDVGGGGEHNVVTIPHKVPEPVPVRYQVPEPVVVPGPQIFEGPQRPAALHNPQQPAALHAPQQPAAAHAPEQPAAVHAPQQPAALHAPQQPAAAHAPEQPAAVHAPQQPAAVPAPATQESVHAPRSEASVHGPASQNVPTCSTVLHEVVHTVTQTLPSKPTATQMAMSSAAPMGPAVHHAPASSGGAALGAINNFPGSQYAAAPSSSAPAHMYAVPTGAMPNAATHAAQYPASTVTIHKTSSSVAHMQAMPTGAVPGAASHPAQQPSSTLTLQGTPSSSAHMHAMPTGALPIAASHAAEKPASTLTVQAASTFVAIPVYVPGASSAASPSGVSPDRSSHSGVAKATESAPASSTPAKHHGMMFTGAAAAFSPNTALVSVFCGAVALLAYAL